MSVRMECAALILVLSAGTACAQNEASTANEEEPKASAAAAPEQQSTPAPAESRRIVAEVNAGPYEKLTVGERRAVSRAASRMLLHVNRAQEDLAEKNKQEALDNIGKGLTLVEIIDKAFPKREVEVKIEAGGTVYKDTDELKTSMVPIYSDMATVSILGPIRAAQQEAKQGEAKQGEAKQREATKAEKTPVVSDVDLQYTMIALNVDMAEAHLQAARQALSSDQFQAAEMALKAIQKGVVLRYAETDLPLVRARRNLSLAKERLANNQTAQATEALRAASSALKQYAEAGSGERATSMKNVAGEIDSHLKDGKKLEPEKIDGWWDQISSGSGSA